MEDKSLTNVELKRMRSVVKKAGGPRLVCNKADLNVDTYWNIINKRSNNREKYDRICDAAINIIISKDDHAE